VAEDNPNQLIVEIVLDDGSVAKGFANIKKQGEDSASGLRKAFGINGFADLNAAITLARSALALLTSQISDGIKEAIESEQATLRLASALKSVPGVTNDAVNSFRDFTSELSRKVGIDDDVINSNAALLASIGRLSGDGLKNATQAALDLSAGLGISLETAFRRVALAAEGNVAGLQKIGFEFSKGASDSVKFGQALDQINQRFGGLAGSQSANTFGGVVNSLKVAFQDTTQAAGELITKSPAVRELLKFIADGFRAATDQIKELSSNGGLDRLIIQFVKFSQSITNYLIRPLEVFVNFGKVGFNLLEIVIQDLIAVFGTLGSAIAKVFNLVGLKGDLTKSMIEFGDASVAAANEARAQFTGLRDVLEAPLSEGLFSSLSTLSTNLTNLKPVADVATLGISQTKDAVAELNTEIVNGILYGQQFDSAFSAIGSAFSQIGEQMKVAALDIGISAKSIAKSLLSGVGGAAANAFSAFGTAIVNGTNAMDAFINSLLASLGQMAVQMGSMFIAQGLAYLYAGLPNGAALIGAGSALAVVGGVLSGLGGGSAPQSSGVGAAGGGASFGGGIEISPTEVADATDARNVSEGIVINVNGDILGDESSGKRLVDLMNAAFDSSGVSLRQGLA
jgi:hypothetical protein